MLRTQQQLARAADLLGQLVRHSQLMAACYVDFGSSYCNVSMHALSVDDSQGSRPAAAAGELHAAHSCVLCWEHDLDAAAAVNSILLPCFQEGSSYQQRAVPCFCGSSS
jgi:hypothetical protein